MLGESKGLRDEVVLTVDSLRAALFCAARTDNGVLSLSALSVTSSMLSESWTKEGTLATGTALATGATGEGGIGGSTVKLSARMVLRGSRRPRAIVVLR
jgi:hypothetical protein